MKESFAIQQAKSLINGVKGKHLTLDERIETAISLASVMLEEAQKIQTPQEIKHQDQLAGMIKDPVGKVFTTALTDQCFRSKNWLRAADQLIYTIDKFGVPDYLPAKERLALKAVAAMGPNLSQWAIPLLMHLIRKETETVILPGEEMQLKRHIAQRRKEGVRINLNHLGEAILGEDEAKHRLQVYLADLAKPEIEYISVKISTIFSQINLLAWEESIEIIAGRLRQLYRAAMSHSYTRTDGSKVPKFVNLDMEEYRDLLLTVAVFRKVLDEPEFYCHEAGIVLQSYLPDSFLIQQELTVWAMQRIARRGAPIKIRIVKGANLAMEQFEAALKGWPQAPYTNKPDVDANYIRMVDYGSIPEHAKAAHLGIASHNLFDIAYALLLRAEKGIEKEVSFEMLEGMADHMRRVVQKLAGDILLYCPAATKAEFQNAVAYLVRRLDENTAPDNFLSEMFHLKVGSEEWERQADFFAASCRRAAGLSYFPRRTQNRLEEPCPFSLQDGFRHEADTDWSLPQNRRWAKQLLKEWSGKGQIDIPLLIGGKKVALEEGQMAQGIDPSEPGRVRYVYPSANTKQIDAALEAAEKGAKSWSHTPVLERAKVLFKAANAFQKRRADLIGTMVADTGKTVAEADAEISEAVDFLHYYAVNAMEWHQLQDIEWHSKGIIVVTPPWNFPCSIPTGGVAAALAAGNSVILKPPPESVLVGWLLAQLFWEAGISQDVLQFIPCEDDPVGTRLIQDPRVAAVVLTGATGTAKHFMQLRPGLDLVAETGGKNTMVVSAMADRDLAIKDLVQSAFGHAGQKCSACSLAILEAEVYEDPAFRRQLRDAASSLPVGSPWHLDTRVNPLIREAGDVLKRGLTQLEPGEEWLLKPRQDKNNPNLWSPGIKLGVKPGNFTFQNELFGPVLGLVRASTFEEALTLMNETPYGLTAGLQTLDEREQRAWLQKIEAGNCYINRTITGAIVERQPFGGCKESSFGRGFKAGGPNYLTQFMLAKQISLPLQRETPSKIVLEWMKEVNHLISSDRQEWWQASLESDAFFWNHYFSKAHDPSRVLGQDNLQRYVSHPKVILIAQEGDEVTNLLRAAAAALACGTHLEMICLDKSVWEILKEVRKIPSSFISLEELSVKLMKEKNPRVRLLSEPSKELQDIMASAACRLNQGKPLANGRLELLNFVREVSISRDYHRYGNLGEREKEVRAPLPGSGKAKNQCGDCGCHG